MLYGVKDSEEFSELFKSEESFLNLPDMADIDSPLDFVKSKNEQQNDAELLASQTKHPEIYIEKQIGDVHDVICYVKPGSVLDTQWKIALPKSMLESAVKWYHLHNDRPFRTTKTTS